MIWDYSTKTTKYHLASNIAGYLAMLYVLQPPNTIDNGVKSIYIHCCMFKSIASNIAGYLVMLYVLADIRVWQASLFLLCGSYKPILPAGLVLRT